MEIMMKSIFKLFKRKEQRKKCTCDKYEFCTRQIRIRKGGYLGNDKLYVDKRDHFKCGKIQNTIAKMKQAMDIK